jgi:hypothetical protein
MDTKMFAKILVNFPANFAPLILHSKPLKTFGIWILLRCLYFCLLTFITVLQHFLDILTSHMFHGQNVVCKAVAQTIPHIIRGLQTCYVCPLKKHFNCHLKPCSTHFKWAILVTSDCCDQVPSTSHSGDLITFSDDCYPDQVFTWFYPVPPRKCCDYLSKSHNSSLPRCS